MTRALDVSLFTAFDVYLLAMTVLTAALRIELAQKVVRLLRRSRQWPRVRKLVVGHLGALLGPRMLAPVIVLVLLFTVHSIVRTVLFPVVRLTAADLVAQPLLIALIAPSTLVMLERDLRSLRATSGDFREDRLTGHLNLAEAALGAIAQAERVLGRERYGRIVEGVVKPVTRAGIEIVFVPDANRWVRQLALSTATKLLFGLTLYVAWALLLAAR